MALPEIQQAVSVIERATSILLFVPPKPSADSFASMVALYLAFTDQQQPADAVSPSHVPSRLQFLPGSSQVQTAPRVQPEIVVDIAGPTSVADTRQEQLEGGVRLHVVLPEGTDILKENVEYHIRELPYDLIITLGVSDLEELGDLFTQYADFFYNTPVINIDYLADNEHYGTINIVDITASSVAEVVHELITSIPGTTIEADTATVLYAGIVDATDSFQKPSTTPRAFQLAAELMNNNADKESVIQHLVKTKPLHLLKLAGRTYARLRHDEHGQLFWSILRPLDFQESGAKPDDISGVMRELINNISGFNAAFVMYEDSPDHYTVYLRLGKGLTKRRQEIQTYLEATRENSALIFSISAPSLKEAERSVLEQVQSVLPVPAT